MSVYFFQKKGLHLWGLLKRLFGYILKGKGHGIQELAKRLDMSVEELRAFRPSYREFSLPKRSGGSRRILAPNDELKDIQRRILRRLLGRLKCHPSANGFQRGRSIVTNARPHVGKAVVVQMDLKDFFPSTRAKRVHRYFRKIGWNREATKVLVRLCTYEGGLPQGAPTSPRLSNLVNYRLDARLEGLAAGRWIRNPISGEMIDHQEIGATYTRYADDLTFSFSSDDADTVRYIIRLTRHIVAQEGYELHRHKKLRIRRRHARQEVTGLVVNESIHLPRPIRRWLRAVEHRAATGRNPTLTPAQLAGWRALQQMIAMTAK